MLGEGENRAGGRGGWPAARACEDEVVGLSAGCGHISEVLDCERGGAVFLDACAASC